ncbi:MFS general substrate transporter [Metschnikowia bicuspidata var. bicuspidata NRRL YB-4993]|uniref:MFS general substrate transporter n=1 Tax=Metschnikowia bicuspidata var. bicuspidata NRRL YB-4993 TaxID=869754 RepID=A0A1A0HC58_9ASCO|nr:MFS general substrate transporter [Metschnikowia bicuspidata var. bicuspidata NRRL YB-4993]OBA21591.1 MFS general substrate transporter [Metschnikowia bicuspidata var. bicuspidata NRRL YB-4993]
MSFLKEPLSRLKWGFIPVRRIVDEDIEPQDLMSDSKESLQESNYENLETSLDTELIEYRDEANRPWWKFFDEYEYRLNKHVRTGRKWYKWFDDKDTPEERKLHIKIDILLTFYALIAYWAKYLDQTNLNNAYVAGLKESLDMSGNDLVNTQVLFSVGNIIFQLPFIYVLNGLPLNYVLPCLDICWSLFTIGASKVTSLTQLKVIRFFVGVFEAPLYLSFMYLIGTFTFDPAMLARRTMIFYFGQYLGILTSGLISGAIVRNFDGVGGLDAWRWIFIIDGILSVGVGILGFYMLPGTPTDCYSIWLTDDEIRLLRRKLKENHTAGRPHDNLFKALFSWNIWKLILTSWEIYVITVWIFLVCNNSSGISGAYILWLDSLDRYSAGKLQDLSALTPGLGIVWLFLTCMWADMFQLRWSAILISQAFNILGNVILAVWNVPESLKWFAWCLQYFGWAMAPVLYSWQNEICRRDAQKRAVVLVTMNRMGSASFAYMSVLVWKTVEAPRFLKGYSFTAACAFGLCIWTFVVLYFYKRQERMYARQNGIVLFNSATDPEPIETRISSSESDDKKLD